MTIPHVAAGLRVRSSLARRLLPLVVLAAAAAPAAQASDAPELRGTTLVSTRGGPAAAGVDLSRQTTLHYDDPWRHVSIVRASGPYAGLAIQDRSRRRTFMLIQPYAACSAWRCPASMFAETTWTTLPGRPGDAAPPPVLDLPRGRYTLYALAAPGHSATIRLRLPALGGRSHVTATRRVNAQYREHVAAGAGATYQSGALVGSLSGPGVVIAHLWSRALTVKGREELVGSYNMRQSAVCIRRGTGYTDPLHDCPLPAREKSGSEGTGLGGGVMATPRPGAHSVIFSHAATNGPETRIGTFGFWLTFL